jgi:hypothetical protein
MVMVTKLTFLILLYDPDIMGFDSSLTVMGRNQPIKARKPAWILDRVFG